MAPHKISSLSKLQKLADTNKAADVILKISAVPGNPGLTLLELLSALEIVRHSRLLISGIFTTGNLQNYATYQALFQIHWYYPHAVFVKTSSSDS